MHAKLYRIIPYVRSIRSCMVVEIPVKVKLFNTLPDELQTQNIKVHPVVFSMGINEAATLAER